MRPITGCSTSSTVSLFFTWGWSATSWVLSTGAQGTSSRSKAATSLGGHRPGCGSSLGDELVEVGEERIQGREAIVVDELGAPDGAHGSVNLLLGDGCDRRVAIRELDHAIGIRDRRAELDALAQ